MTVPVQAEPYMLVVFYGALLIRLLAMSALFKFCKDRWLDLIIESDKKENNEMLDWSRFNVVEKNDGLFFIMKRFIKKLS